MIKIEETNEMYHQRAEVSSSALKTIYKKSVWHWVNQTRTQTKSFTIGTDIHDILQDPKYFEQNFVALPEGLNLRFKKDKELKAELEAEHPNKRLIKQEEWQMYKSILENYNDNLNAQEYMYGHIELSHLDTIDGLGVRVRPDCVAKDYTWMSDIKTCQDNSPEAFRREAYKYAYPLQAQFYCMVCGVPIDEFRFITVETKAPYNIAVYAMSDEMIDWGLNALKKAWKEYKFFKETGAALGYIRDDINEKGEIRI